MQAAEDAPRADVCSIVAGIPRWRALTPLTWVGFRGQDGTLMLQHLIIRSVISVGLKLGTDLWTP